MTKLNWTPRDEQVFQELGARREKVLAARLQAVIEAVRPVANRFKMPVAELADVLSHHADEIRDALEPYDSGCRVAPAEDA